MMGKQQSNFLLTQHRRTPVMQPVLARYIHVVLN